MARISPDQLIIRCYGEKKGGKWVGICLNFNLAIEADSADKLVKKMNEVIKSYLESVYDTDNKSSIPELVSRRAPLRDWCKYYVIRAAYAIKNFRAFFTFEEAIPIRLAVGSY